MRDLGFFLIGKIAVPGTPDPQTGSPTAQFLRRARRDARLTSEKVNANTALGCPFAELRNQIRPDQIIAKRFTSQSTGHLHSGSVVQHQVGRIQDITKEEIRICQIHCVGVSNVDFKRSTALKTALQRSQGFFPPQPSKSNPQDRYLVPVRATRSDGLADGLSHSHDSDLPGRSPTSLAGNIALSSPSRTTRSRNKKAT